MNLSEEQYAAGIPACCSQRTMESHMHMMLCWGLVRALENGRTMDCSGCDLKMPDVSLLSQIGK